MDDVSLLLEKDMVQSLVLLEDLQKLLQGTPLEDRYKKLAQNMDQFDVDGARRALKEIKGTVQEMEV